MKFLHTADWQIGMKADFVGNASQTVRDERLAAGKRVVDAANEEAAEFILIAGDLFEDNAVERTLIQRIVDILARFHGPVYLIPGNHDPLVPGSVWGHPAWRSAQNLVVLTEAKPVEIPGGILFPCPVLDKYSRKNPTAWITEEPGDAIRLALAHGNVEGLPQVDPDHPISRNAVQRAGLDYLALGHWHSAATYPDSKGSVRMAYSGTHETARFGERDSGHAIVVEIAAPGAPPDVRPIQTGRLRWQILESEIGTPGDLRALRRNLEGIDSPEILLLDLRLKGVLYSEEKEDFFHIEDLIASRFLYGRIEASQLFPSPEDARWIESLPSGIFQEVAGRLHEMTLTGGREAETASRALLELYAIIGEGLR
ncbi:MAG: DNA repair exonuclease [Desulfobacterales bacterium]